MAADAGTGAFIERRCYEGVLAGLTVFARIHGEKGAREDNSAPNAANWLPGAVRRTPSGMTGIFGKNLKNPEAIAHSPGKLLLEDAASPLWAGRRPLRVLAVLEAPLGR